MSDENLPQDIMARAEAVLDEMRNGPIVDVSPERSVRIIARALAEEREACAKRVEDYPVRWNEEPDLGVIADDLRRGDR